MFLSAVAAAASIGREWGGWTVAMAAASAASSPATVAAAVAAAVALLGDVELLLLGQHALDQVLRAVRQGLCR